MSSNNAKPKKLAPVVVLRDDPSNLGRYLLLFLPAIFGSVFLHTILVVIFVIYAWFQKEPDAPPMETAAKETMTADPVEDQKKETFLVTDIDPAAVEFDTDIQFNNKRIEEVSVPGAVDPNQAVGILGGDTTVKPFNIPAPGGFGSLGQGGAMEVLSDKGNSDAKGMTGGYGPRGLPLDKNFGGRGGSTRETSLREGGGTTESEVAVAEGLKWLIRQQLMDGRWSTPGAGADGDVASTALGLLPFLAAGKTHLGKDKNPYDKNIGRALEFLKNGQNAKTGFFGGRMYGHALATIAMCEAFGLSQDPLLRKYAQGGINLIVATQSPANGGWSYGPDKDSPHRDLSISGWQIMALKSGQMAGLIVPSVAIERSKKFLDDVAKTEGYAYTSASSATHRMTAVGLLCRQYMQNWGPANPNMIAGTDKWIKPYAPDKTDVYYYYYATQVMHHMGGEGWKNWNEAMRDTLVKRQDKSNGPNRGSWTPTGMDAQGHINDRLIVTSLSLLTLEVYYRYLPLYYRDAGYSKDRVVKSAV